MPSPPSLHARERERALVEREALGAIRSLEPAGAARRRVVRDDEFVRRWIASRIPRDAAFFQ